MVMVSRRLLVPLVSTAFCPIPGGLFNSLAEHIRTQPNTNTSNALGVTTRSVVAQPTYSVTIQYTGDGVATCNFKSQGGFSYATTTSRTTGEERQGAEGGGP